MVTIYDDYHDEPEDIFLPLTEDLHNGLYDLEMDCYTEDALYYDAILPERGSLLELGCGSGRIAGAIRSAQRDIIGIDLSQALLMRAVSHNWKRCSFICMDMARLAFSRRFDAILIPYNTLNLLTTKERIISCLAGCRKSLNHGGRLMLQLFIPDRQFRANNTTTFQFQMFKRPGSGRIIKEILKTYLPAEEMVSIEERYRIRPMDGVTSNEDLHTVFTISGFSLQTWLSLFKNCGFTLLSGHSDFQGTPFVPGISTRLIGVFTPSSFSS